MDSVSFIPPARRSLSDEELANLLSQPHTETNTVLDSMQLLETQTTLRAEDDAIAAAWCSQMRAINSVESMNALNQFLGLAPAGQAEVSNGAPAEAIAQVAPKSLFEELAAASAAAPRPISNPSAVENPSPLDVKPEPELEVLVVAPPEPETFVPETPAPAQEMFPLVPVTPQAPSITNSLISKNDEPHGGDDNAEQAISEVQEANDDSAVSEFDALIGIAPQSSADFLDEARASVSTAHSAKSNQHASSLFFNWLPIVGSVAPVLIAVYLHSIGLSLSESLVALTAAILAAFITTTTGAIAGKRSGLQTFIVSRATFGVYGARIPASVFAILKLAAASLMVLLLVIASNRAQDGWSVEGVSATRWQVGPISVALWQAIIGVSVLLVSMISFVKLRFVKFLNLTVGLAASIGVVAALVMQLSSGAAEFHLYYIESWQMTLGASAIAFAGFGTIWSSSGADFASGLHKSIRGSRVIGWSFLSLFVIPAAIGSATLLVLQNKSINYELLGLASVLPEAFRPFGFALLAAVLLLLASLELRSTRFALTAVNSWFGSNLARVLLALAFVLLSLAGWHFYSTQGILYNLRDYALICSVPVTAWLGIFTADTLFRRIAFHEVSLTRSYGFYGNFNWMNLLGWLLATELGLGFVSSSLQEFQWAGFLSKLTADPAFWADANVGLAVAFAVGVLLPLLLGVPRIRRQEAEVLAIESRRYELRDVMVSSEPNVMS